MEVNVEREEARDSRIRLSKGSIDQKSKSALNRQKESMNRRNWGMAVGFDD